MQALISLCKQTYQIVEFKKTEEIVKQFIKE